MDPVTSRDDDDDKTRGEDASQSGFTSKVHKPSRGVSFIDVMVFILLVFLFLVTLVWFRIKSDQLKNEMLNMNGTPQNYNIKRVEAANVSNANMGFAIWKIKPKSENVIGGKHQKRMRKQISLLEESITFSSTDAAHAPRSAFLFRTYQSKDHPSEPTMKRIASMAADLQKLQHIDVFLSIDKHKDGDVSWLEEVLAQHNAKVESVQWYDTHELVDKYPGLAPFAKKANRAFHVQAVDHWLLSLPKHQRHYETIWVAEDDIGYTGDIADLIRAYASDDSDLISSNKPPTVVTKDWYWSNFLTKEYENKVGPAKRFRMQEHIQRFSERLLQELHMWSARGALAQSEAMVPTVCVEAGFKIRNFQAEHVGNPWCMWSDNTGACDNGELPVSSQEQWQNIMTKDAKGPGRLYHPLKF